MTVIKFRPSKMRHRWPSNQYSLAIFAGGILGVAVGLGLLALDFDVAKIWRGGKALQSEWGTFVGRATPIDGDDLLLDGNDNRLSGIDAFEKDQHCGAVACGVEAQKMLASIVAGKEVTCQDTGKRDGQRIIALCSVGELDIQEQMVMSGWALTRPDFAGDRTSRLCMLEATAATTKTGAWGIVGYVMQPPYFWKGGKRKTLKQISCPSSRE